jgi:hypothetical protein
VTMGSVVSLDTKEDTNPNDFCNPRDDAPYTPSEPGEVAWPSFVRRSSFDTLQCHAESLI